jgi:hypothetical protein
MVTCSNSCACCLADLGLFVLLASELGAGEVKSGNGDARKMLRLSLKNIENVKKDKL